MNIPKIKAILPFLLIFLLIFFLFWQFFINGLHPFPGNYMLAWYEPWKTDNFSNGTISLSHKPVADDVFRYLFPFKILGIEEFKKLEVPLWNPYNGAGMPLLATYQSGIFNPLNILFFYFSNTNAWSLSVILQALFLAIFTYLYCRKIKISIFGSLISTVSFLFSGLIIARLIFGNIVYPIITLPILLYLVEEHLEEKPGKKILFLPFVIALLFFSGHPHIQMYVLLTVAFYFIYKAILKRKERRIFSKLISFVSLSFLGILIASIQLLPTLELFSHSNISFESSKFIFERFLLPPFHLINILIPNYFGNQATYNYWGAGDFIESVASIGLIPCFFAFLAFLRRKLEGNELFFLALLIISVFSTINWLVPKIFFSFQIPLISNSPPSRIFVIGSFTIAVLAGYGFDKYLIYKKRFRELFYRILPYILIIFAILIWTFLAYSLGISCNNIYIKDCRLIALRNSLFEMSFFATFLGLLFIGAKFKLLSKITPFFILSLIIIVGLYNAYKFLPFSPGENVMPSHPLIEVLKTVGNERVFAFGTGTIKTNLATQYRFFDPNYYDPLYNIRYAELISFSNRDEISNLSRSDIEITPDINIPIQEQSRRERLLNLLGVGYLVYKKNEITKTNDFFWEDKNWYLLKNNNDLKRAYLANTFELINDQELILKRLFDPAFDFQEKVIIEKPLTNFPVDDKKGKLEITDLKETSVVLRSETKSNKLLVLLDNYFPGWKAFIDGKEIEIYRANYTFRAVKLPAGIHEIKFSYEPDSFKIGTQISSASLFLYVTFCIIYLKRLRPRRIFVK